MLEHGGRIRQAALHYGLAPELWLDLSTGINPQPWSGPRPPITSWARLPEDEDGLADAAQRYYGAPWALPVAGSQAAIQALPRLRRACRVGVLAPLYAEHEHCWRMAGHEVLKLPIADAGRAVGSCDVLIVVNPNNPDGRRIGRNVLLEWHARLAARGGWLLVDEAFADTTPALSLAADCSLEGLIVLRSLGKFFGLAGARVGFVLAAAELLALLAEQLGPWSMAGPSRHAARCALQDTAWQATARSQLERNSRRLAALLAHYGLSASGGCALFQWVPTPRAAIFHERLARRGVLTRLFDDPAGLRFGLPGTDADWFALESALFGAIGEACGP